MAAARITGGVMDINDIRKELAVAGGKDLAGDVTLPNRVRRLPAHPGQLVNEVAEVLQECNGSCGSDTGSSARGPRPARAGNGDVLATRRELAAELGRSQAKVDELSQQLEAAVGNPPSEAAVHDVVARAPATEV